MKLLPSAVTAETALLSNAGEHFKAADRTFDIGSKVINHLFASRKSSEIGAFSADARRANSAENDPEGDAEEVFKAIVKTFEIASIYNHKGYIPRMGR